MTASPPYPHVDQEIFSGPIDLLVDEVRRQNVPVEEIAMAPLAARFLEYVHAAPGRNLNLDIEWLHWAATLIQWKSRSLLPQDPRETPPGRDPVRDELARLVRQHRKEAAGHLAEQKRQAEARLSRPPDPLLAPDLEPEEAELPFWSVWDLIGQARDLAHWIPAYRAAHRHWEENLRVQTETVTVSQMSQVLRDALASAPSLPFNALPLLVAQPTPAHLSCLFLGLLEMVRDQEITVEQIAEGRLGPGNDLKGGIWVRGASLTD